MPVSARSIRTGLLLWAVAVSVAAGDEIIAGTQTYHRIRITGCHGNRVEFRTTGEDHEYLPLDSIDFIRVDSAMGMADFNQAEDYLLGGQAAQALTRYERAGRAAQGHWDALIRVRLLVAAERSGAFEKAVRVWLEVAQSDPVTAAFHMPLTVPESSNRGMERTRRRLEQALRERATEPARTLIELLLFAVMVEQDPAAATGQAAEIASRQLPVATVSKQTMTIQEEALGLLLERGRYDAVVSAVDVLMEKVPAEYLPALLLRKAQARYASADDGDAFLGAAVTAMRVAIHFSTDPLAGDALLLAAQAHRHAGLQPDAERLLRHALTLDAVPGTVKTRARAVLQQWNEERGASAPDPSAENGADQEEDS